MRNIKSCKKLITFFFCHKIEKIFPKPMSLRAFPLTFSSKKKKKKKKTKTLINLVVGKFKQK